MRRPKQNGSGDSLLRGKVYSHRVKQSDALKGKPEISLLVRNCEVSSSGVPNSIGPDPFDFFSSSLTQFSLEFDFQRAQLFDAQASKLIS